MFLPISVSNFFDFVERSESECLVFVNRRSKILAIVAVFDLLKVNEESALGFGDRSVENSLRAVAHTTRKQVVTECLVLLEPSPVT